MDRHELNEMFDELTPEPARERELLDQLLCEGTRGKKTMKNWKRVVIGVAAAALLVTAAAAATATITMPEISQKLLEYLGMKPGNERAAELLAPGAASLDIRVEDNGITLHITQVLRESRSIIVMADFTAQEGKVLDYTEEDQLYCALSSYLPVYDDGARLLDKDGNQLEGGPQLSGGWSVIDDDDLKDNHLTLVCRMEFEPDSAYMREAVSLRLPSPHLYRFKRGGLEEVYSGDWSCVVPLPQADTRWTLNPDHAAGELDGAVITVEELYLSPATLNITLKRDRPATVAIDAYGAVIDQKEEDVYVRWSELAKDAAGITLTTKDGRTVPVELYTSNVHEGDQWWSYRLDEITDPAEFQGGTLTLDWAFGTVTIPLDNLMPVEP
ncbi:MAG: hypothetical protein HDT38_06065 [Clostridiales bacterium]|nr:hypothetical protein [Clostridiales bacterium]